MLVYRVALACAGLIAVLALLWSPTSAVAQIRTEGRCSPVFERSEIAGPITINCADLAPLENRLNKLITESRLSRDQVAELVAVLNALERSRIGHGRLSGVMTTFLAGAMAAVAPNEDVNVFMAQLDGSDPIISASEERVVVYQLIAMPDFLADEASTCSVEDDIVISGTRITAAKNRDGSARMSVNQLTATDPVLRRICQGLALPLQAIGAGGGVPSRQRLSVYDYLSAGKHGVVLMLSSKTPPPNLRLFWTEAFFARAAGTSPQLSVGPDTFGGIVAAGTGTPGDLVEFDLSIDAHGFEETTAQNAYPATVREEFGQELRDMDTQWLSAIADQSVVLHGRRLPLFVDGVAQPVLQRYRVDELSTPAFWVQIKDGTDLLHQFACYAARFAVDGGYVAAGDLPHYGRCGAMVQSR